jgi:phenylpropionate dioxygenase-like ring-hydroxylating dioxygenase large terminal subunit
MHHDQLIDVTRRTLKLARDKTTDLAPAQHRVEARDYTSVERHNRDRALLLASPQLVGYVSELADPGAYCTKTVMGRSILPSRTSDGSVKAFDNVCLHRQSQVVTGCGSAKRLSCPYHAWTYDNTGRLVSVPGREGFPDVTVKSDGRGNCTVFDAYGPHHRLIFPLNAILELDSVPEEQWDPFQNMVVIYALFPNIVLSVTIANGELFRIYPGDRAGRSITVHQNSTPLDISEESVAAGAQAVFEYAHATVRDEDYRLVESLQANLESGAREHLLFGRNEPGLQHRHITWAQALAEVRQN